jgi:hypothetical protein
MEERETKGREQRDRDRERNMPVEFRWAHDPMHRFQEYKQTNHHQEHRIHETAEHFIAAIATPAHDIEFQVSTRERERVNKEEDDRP